MAAKKKAAPERAITLHDHIKELRNRLFVVALVFIAVTAVAYNYKDTLVYYLLKPLGDEKLIYLNPAGGFSFIFQITMYVGIAASVPFLVYNLYKFVAPALPARAQKHSIVVMLVSLVLLSAGVAFGYLFAIPGALNFLNHFAEGYVIPTLTAESYLNFILAYTAGLGILFQLPLVLFFIHWIHPLKPSGLLKFERYLVLIAFVAAAMITPTPDVMNQTVMALPIVIMYQIGVIAICISIFRAKRRVRKLEKQQTKLALRREKNASKRVAPVTPVAMPSFHPAIVSSARSSSASVKPMAFSSVTTKPQSVSKGKVMDIMSTRTPVERSLHLSITPPARPNTPTRQGQSLKVPPRVMTSPSLRRMAPSIDGVSIIY